MKPPKLRKRLPKRIFRGVVLLDVHQPDWLERVNLGSLNLELDGNDVLGQVYGSYAQGLHRLDLTRHASVHHGFHVHTKPWNADRMWAVLTQEWKRIITLAAETRDITLTSVDVVSEHEHRLALERRIRELEGQVRALGTGAPVDEDSIFDVLIDVDHSPPIGTRPYRGGA